MTQSSLRNFILVSALIIGGWMCLPLPASAVTCAAGQSEIALHVVRPDGSPVRDAKIVIWTQVMSNNQRLLGKALVSGRVDVNGNFSTCVATTSGPYAINIYTSQITRGNMIVWQDGLTQTPTGWSATVHYGQLSVTFRDPDGNVLRRKTFNIYQQVFDTSHRVIVSNTTLVRSGLTTGDSGRVDLNLGPGTYVLRVAGTFSKYPIILTGRQVSGDTLTVIDEPLPALDITTKDGNQTALSRWPFSLHVQTKTKGASAPGVLINSALRTDKSGRYIAYLPVGTYVTTTHGSFSQFVFRKYDLNVREKTVTPVAYRLSGIRLLLRRDNGNLADKGSYSLYEQQTNPNGVPGIASVIVQNRSIGKAGYRNLYLPVGTYIVDAAKNRYEQIEVFPDHLTRLEVPNSVTYYPNDQLTLTTPLSNRRLTVRTTSAAVVPGAKRVLSKTYRVRAAKFAAPYTVVLAYTNAKAASDGTNTSKIRIAQYQDAKKKWKIVGRYDAARQHVAAVLGGAGTLALIELQ